MRTKDRLLFLLLFSLISLFLQTTLFPSIFPSFLPGPNLILTLVVFWAFYQPGVAGCFVAFVLGLLLDVSSGVLVGPWAAACVVVYCVFATIVQRVFVEAATAAVVLVAIASLLADLVWYGITVQFRPVTGGYEMLSQLIVHAITSGIFAPAVFVLMRKFLFKKESKRLRGAMSYKVRS